MSIQSSVNQPHIHMAIAARSDVGRVRTNNEDAYALLNLTSGQPLLSGAALDLGSDSFLLALSDGMGGHQAGEVASSLVIQTLSRRLQTEASESIERAIELAVGDANTAVVVAAREGRKHGMGATLTAVVLAGSEAWVVEVGDSRAYLWRGGKMKQLTRDQSLVQVLVDSGAMTAEEAMTSPQKNIILQAMGLASTVHAAIGRLSLRRGDRLLLCCDGLSNAIADDELSEIVSQHDVAVACDRLIDLANERGGNDNLTAITATFDGDGLVTPLRNESVTSTIQVVQEFGSRGVTAVLPPSPNLRASSHPSGYDAGDGPRKCGIGPLEVDRRCGVRHCRNRCVSSSVNTSAPQIPSTGLMPTAQAGQANLAAANSISVERLLNGVVP